ncbi:hypothetical protein KUV62_06740 [Salipiger bermudensis]|uniref:hypothetical protein n=1 Tax=Salipiger bermudensis TaxID=344736 RepID=UPI001C995407|nr:hypothetical protein [Salipiger bermudensis]MBY6003596.1 hypothetical protein [Salipiger bermudensis]
MSAPDTNIKTQEKQHKGPLVGIWGGLGIVAILLVGWLAWVFAAADDSEPAAATTEPAAATETEAGSTQMETAPAAND